MNFLLMFGLLSLTGQARTTPLEHQLPLDGYKRHTRVVDTSLPSEDWPVPPDCLKYIPDVVYLLPESEKDTKGEKYF